MCENDGVRGDAAMPMPRTHSDEALVLRRMDFSEADRLLTLFTLHGGKLRAIAKGARKIPSRLAGGVELLARTQLLLASGRELDIVTQAESREMFAGLRASLWHATAGYYLAEALDRALEDRSPAPEIYHLAVATLRRLEADAVAWQADPAPDNQAGPAARGWAALRWFELRLLDELGYRPSFHQCVACEAELQAVEDNGFNAELGGALCPACSRHAQRRLPLLTLKVLRLVQSREWDDLPVMRLDVRTRDDVEAIVQGIFTIALDRALTSWSYLHRT